MAEAETKETDVKQWPPRWFGVVTWIAIGVVAAGIGLWLAKRQAEGGAKQVTPPARGLPHTPDYHALLVSPTDARRVVLGTHAGLYVSSDGGRTWKKGQLAGNDAMNLVRTRQGRIWAAGHNVLFASDDGGDTWMEVRPDGLPGLDLHGFTAAPDGALYAAVAGRGLYQSRDGGRTFTVVSKDVGGGVFGLAITPSGRILAADASKGLLASNDGGKTWRTLAVPAIGVAVNPGNAKTVVATGDGIFLSINGGKKWRRVLNVGAGPVAWSPSRPSIAYAIGGTRDEPTVYRTMDGGRTWRSLG